MFDQWRPLGWSLLVGLLLLLGLFLYLIRAAVVPFAYALVLTYLLVPLVEYLERRGLSRVAAILLVYSGTITLLAVVLLGIVPPALVELDTLAHMIPSYTKEISDRLNEMQRLYSKVPLPASLRQVVDENIMRMEYTLLTYIRSIATFTMALFSHLLAIVIAPVLAFYMLRDLPAIKAASAAFFSAERTGLGSLIRELNIVLDGFIRGHLLVAAIVGLISVLGLSLLQIEFALLIGMAAGILDIIPYFGPIIGALPAIFLALLESPVKALYVAILFIIIHQLESTIISPKILGDRVGLHPLTVIFVILVGGQLAGIAGVLLAVPLTAGIKACFNFWYISCSKKLRPAEVDRK